MIVVSLWLEEIEFSAASLSSEASSGANSISAKEDAVLAVKIWAYAIRPYGVKIMR